MLLLLSSLNEDSSTSYQAINGTTKSSGAIWTFSPPWRHGKTQPYSFFTSPKCPFHLEKSDLLNLESRSKASFNSFLLLLVRHLLLLAWHLLLLAWHLLLLAWHLLLVVTRSKASFVFLTSVGGSFELRKEQRASSLELRSWLTRAVAARSCPAIRSLWAAAWAEKGEVERGSAAKLREDIARTLLVTSATLVVTSALLVVTSATLLATKGIPTRSRDATRGTPGLTTGNKKLLVAPGIATRSPGIATSNKKLLGSSGLKTSKRSDNNY